MPLMCVCSKDDTQESTDNGIVEEKWERTAEQQNSKQSK